MRVVKTIETKGRVSTLKFMDKIHLTKAIEKILATAARKKGMIIKLYRGLPPNILKAIKPKGKK
jgi:hypothetical protein